MPLARRTVTPLYRLLSFLRAGIAALTLASLPMLGGCARTPAGANVNSPNQLLVEVRVNGTVNPSRYYFFAMNATDNANTSQGPIPVLTCPWGNGWGAGAITHYVQIGGPNQPGFYRLYRFPQTGDPAEDLLNPTPVSGLLAFDDFQNQRVFRFSLDLDLIQTPAGAPAPNLNINIISTDRLPLNPNDCSDKLVDSLGPRGSSTFISIPTNQVRTYRNGEALQQETQGDVVDPDLDLVDWQIEVRRR